MSASREVTPAPLLRCKVNPTSAVRFLRLTVASGWDDFVSIRKVSIE